MSVEPRGPLAAADRREQPGKLSGPTYYFGVSNTNTPRLFLAQAASL